MERLVREAGYTGPVDRFLAYSDFAAFLDAEPAPMPDDPVALFVGVLEPSKGVDILLDAFAEVLRRVPTSELWIVGDGPQRSELGRQVDRLGIETAVRLFGARPRTDLPGLFDEARVLVLPSRSEGLGRVIVEAMARGRPVVASRVGGVVELVEDGVTGLLVPPEDPAGLAEALVRPLADRELAGRMGIKARHQAEARDPSREFADGIARLAAWGGE
jgi:glycosyltransferase involved in cell wall biosynthesis